MRAVRRRAIGCAAVAATGAVLLATAGAQADVGPNQVAPSSRIEVTRAARVASSTIPEVRRPETSWRLDTASLVEPSKRSV